MVRKISLAEGKKSALVMSPAGVKREKIFALGSKSSFAVVRGNSPALKAMPVPVRLGPPPWWQRSVLIRGHPLSGEEPRFSVEFHLRGSPILL